MPQRADALTPWRLLDLVALLYYGFRARCMRGATWITTPNKTRRRRREELYACCAHTSADCVFDIGVVAAVPTRIRARPSSRVRQRLFL